MENLWIYVLLIFIFVVRAIAKNAQKQINANKKSVGQDEEYMPEEVEDTDHPADRPLTWEDFFPSETKRHIPPVVIESGMEMEKPEPAPQPVIAKKESEVVNAEPVVSESEMNITNDAYNNSISSDLLPYGTEELRKAVIASEILAKKF